MVGVNFFFDICSHSGLRAFFTSDFANCTTDYAPSIRCCSQHLMVGGFFLTCSPILNWGHFSQVILPIVLQFMPNHQVLFTAPDGWGYFFFLTCSPVLDLGHFSQVILPIGLQIMPPPKNNPNHQVPWTASGGCCLFSFDLFSHSGLRAFFTSDFANCTTNYVPAQK